jgi:hypothetical protein
MDGANRIANWANLTSRANCDFSQSSSGAKPTWDATGFNGLPVVRYTATASQYFDGGAGCLPLTSGISGATFIWVGQRVSATGAVRVLEGVATGTGTSRLLFQTSSSGVRQIAGRRLDSESSATTVSFGASTLAPVIVIAIVDYANAKAAMYENGAKLGVVDFITPGAVSSTDALRVRSGSGVSTSPSTYHDGYTAETASLLRVLTASEIVAAERLLSRTWRIPITV